MKIGVPGEFHEVRWQRTEEDSERLCSRAHGKRAGPIGYKLSRGKGGLLTALWHGDHAHRYFRAIPACRNGLVSDLRHSDPAHRYLSAIPAWQNRHLSSLRHGHPAHKYLRGISAWQSRHLSSLRHGHPVYRYSSAIPTCRTIQQSLSNRPLTVPRPVLATATLPTDTSVPSPRAETYQNRSLKDVPSGS